MMTLVAAWKAPEPIRPAARLIDFAKSETLWTLLGRVDVDPAQEHKLRTLLLAEWRAARAGTLQPEYFYSTARDMGITLARLILIRRARTRRPQ